jgi:hypothetical protein
MQGGSAWGAQKRAKQAETGGINAKIIDGGRGSWGEKNGMKKKFLTAMVQEKNDQKIQTFCVLFPVKHSPGGKR